MSREETLIIAKTIVLFLSIVFLINLVSADLDSDLTNNGLSFQIDVLETNLIIINYVPIVDSDTDITNFNNSAQEHFEFLESTYPISSSKLNLVATQNPYNPTLSTPLSIGPVSNFIERVNLLRGIYRFGRISGGEVNRVVGLTSAGWFDEHGASEGGKGFAIFGFNAVITESGSKHSSAHELGHTVDGEEGNGLCEEYDRFSWELQHSILGGCPNGDSDNDNDLDSECLAFGGCPTTTLERLVPWLNNPQSLAEVNMRNFMGLYSSENSRWVSKDTYNHLLSGFPSSGQVISIESVVLGKGIIDKDGSVLFDPLYVLNETSFLNESISQGNYSILIKSGESNFYTNSFEPSFLMSFIGGNTTEINVTSFAFVLPFNESVTQIILQNSTTILAQRNVSDNTPVVEINSSINGQSFNDDFVVKWNASDADDDNLTYSVLLSDDGGNNFTTVALDINQTNLTIKNSLLNNGSEYVVKVLATDGVRTGVAMNNLSFSVQPDPSIELISPADDTTLITNDIMFRYRVAVLGVNITNCSLFVNDSMQQTNTSEILQGEIMNFSQSLIDGDYNWTVECTDTRGYIGETETRNLGISKFTPHIIDWGVTPNPQGFGENVTIFATLNVTNSVDVVILNVTRPNGNESSYVLTNISDDTWAYNFTDYINGTYNFTFFVNYSNGLSTEESGKFYMLVNLITYCQHLNLTVMSFSLIKNISSSGTCLNVTANNVTISGGDYSLTYGLAQGAGILSNGFYNYTSIKNIRILAPNGSRKNPAIEIHDSRGLNITNVYIRISCNSTVSDANCHGISLLDTKNRAYISNSNIYILVSNPAHGDKSHGISVNGGSISGPVSGHLLNNLTIIVNSSNGAGVVISGGNDGINDINLENLDIYSKNYYSIHINGGNNGDGNVNVSNVKSVSDGGSTRYPLYLQDSVSGPIKNSNFSSQNAPDVFVTGTHNFTNSSYIDEFVISSATLTRKWYYRAFVNDTSGIFISNVNVTAFNVTNGFQFNSTTASNGFTSTTEITEYINDGGNKTYYSNYTIYASHPNYTMMSHQRNITSLTNIYKDVFTMTSSP